MGTKGKRSPTPPEQIDGVAMEEVLTERELAAQMRREMRLQEQERRRAAEREERKKRKPLAKAKRMAVYNKYDGHCAYCGCKLEYTDMQVDHAVAVHGGEQADQMLSDGMMNGIENLMPACRQCNFYKEAYDIEGFRWKIREILQHSCVNTFQARLAMKYGIVTFNGWDGKFFFETFNKQ